MRMWMAVLGAALLVVSPVAEAGRKGKGKRGTEAASHLGEPGAAAVSERPVAPELDWTRLHGEWLPTWGASGRFEEEIVAELAKAPELQETFQQISKLSWADNVGNFQRIATLFDRMNAWHEAHGLPWRYDVVGLGAQLGVRVSEVHAVATAEGSDARALVVARVDSLNVGTSLVEWPRDANLAVVPLRNVRNRLVVTLWPDAVGEDAALIAELGLSEADRAVLAEVWPARKAADAALDGVRDRARCSRYSISRLPVEGLDAKTRTSLGTWPTTGDCPAITPGELAALDAYTEAVEAHPGLIPALERLAAVAVVPHVRWGLGGLVACADKDCAPTERSRAGVLAALADEARPRVAARVVCDLAENRLRDASSVDEELGVCAASDGVAAAARAAHEAEFGPVLGAVAGLPEAVPVTFVGRP